MTIIASQMKSCAIMIVLGRQIKFQFTEMFGLNRRFLVAGAIPFLCVFSQTLLQYNIIFALGGMVNHTLADLEEWKLVKPRNLTFPGTCIAEKGLLEGNISVYKDGPFPWDAEVEGLINATISAGMMVGTLMTLFVYDYINLRHCSWISGIYQHFDSSFCCFWRSFSHCDLQVLHWSLHSHPHPHHPQLDQQLLG